jgi:hypothetical protein
MDVKHVGVVMMVVFRLDVKHVCLVMIVVFRLTYKNTHIVKLDARFGRPFKFRDVSRNNMRVRNDIRVKTGFEIYIFFPLQSRLGIYFSESWIKFLFICKNHIP